MVLVTMEVMAMDTEVMVNTAMVNLLVQMVFDPQPVEVKVLDMFAVYFSRLII